MTTTMHWARWGDPQRAGELPAATRALVTQALGIEAAPAPAVELADVRLPESRLPAALLEALQSLLGAAHVRTDHESRVRHTRGKSTPDLVRMRAGDGTDAPDAVLLPADPDQVQAVLALAVAHRTAVVPFGGGTSVVGGLVAERGGLAGVLALDLQRLDQLLELDEVSQVAHLQAGLLGPAAEALLNARGFTIGHYPQSFEYASIGGFAAARSSGQSSAGYGRFDANVVGLTVATPAGTVRLGSAPANAAGPDLRQLFLGSEGAFGVITSVRVRVRPVPAVREYEAWRFAGFDAGAAALRALAQDGPLPTVLRLSDEAETFVNLADPTAVGAAEAAGCLLLTGFEGTAARVATTRAAVTELLTGLGGTPLGAEQGEAWVRGRFDAPYLRDSLLDVGALVETLETTTFWSGLAALYAGVRDALAGALTAAGTPPLVLCHISHVYPTGASLYFTVAARQAADPLAQWQAAKAAAGDAIVAAGASITHHHGVGRDHRPWLGAELGEVGVQLLRAVKASLDPTGVLNPGVLVP